MGNTHSQSFAIEPVSFKPRHLYHDVEVEQGTVIGTITSGPLEGSIVPVGRFASPCIYAWEGRDKLHGMPVLISDWEFQYSLPTNGNEEMTNQVVDTFMGLRVGESPSTNTILIELVGSYENKSSSCKTMTFKRRGSDRTLDHIFVLQPHTPIIIMLSLPVSDQAVVVHGSFRYRAITIPMYDWPWIKVDF